jgi:hypothetical protein
LVLRAQNNEDEESKLLALKTAALRLREEVAQLEKNLQEDKKEAKVEIFRSFDVNGDGKVDAQELMNGLRSKYNTFPTGDQLSQAIKKFDADNDGTLGPSEFNIDSIRGCIEEITIAEINAAREVKRLERELVQKIEVEPLLLVDNLENGIGARVLASMPYLLPLLDGESYGRYILGHFPAILGVLDPVTSTFRSIPFSGLIVFFALSYQARNRDLPVLVRFNLQQALQIDVALFLPQFLELIPLDPQLKEMIAVPGSDIVFLALLASVLYSVGTNIATGSLPNKIPLISESAERSIRGPN